MWCPPPPKPEGAKLLVLLVKVWVLLICMQARLAQMLPHACSMQATLAHTAFAIDPV